MVDGRDDHGGEVSLEEIRAAVTLAELAGLLRGLRRRDARERRDTPRTYRELAGKTGWAHGVIGDYFAGKVLPPTDRFDVLVGLLGATAAEQGELATARDRVEEHRRRPAAPEARGAVVPRELPRDVSAFTGRAAQLAELDTVTETAAVIVSGTAGVGKTALAVRWAHRAAARFPDGCLYMDLRGYAPDRPVRPEEALAAFLRSLGLAGAELPPRLPELAGRYRSLLAGRRMLVVLDNAHSADQVRPLLPGTASCVALVTSRDTLAGLVVRDGARRIDLDRLSTPDATGLLRTLIGSRADAEPDAVAALAQRCAHLPLALRIAAELAAARPAAPLADVVADLAGTQRLDRLAAAGDPGTAARGVFSWSYRHLSAPGARTFRLLGLHPGRDLDVAAIAALAGVDHDEAWRQVGELAGAHLVEALRLDRYTLHDLLRDYAAERAGEDPAEERRAAVTRLLDHYLAAVRTAMAALYPAGAGAGAALAWLDAELPNLVAAANHAVDLGWPDYATRLSAALWRYLDTGGHYAEALVIHGHAASVAAERGDLPAEAAALGELGQVHARLGRYEEALAHLDRALALNRTNTTLNSLAFVYSRLGRYDEAISHLEQALSLERDGGNRSGEGKVLSNIGIVHGQLGRFRESREYFARALSVARAVGDRNRESEALNNLGLTDCRLGRFAPALEELRQGLEIARAAGDRGGEGRLLANLGVAHTGLGSYPEAQARLRAALDLHREIGDRAAEAETLCYQADLQHRAGRQDAALEHGERALAVAIEIGERSVVAAALNSTGRALLARQRVDQALARHEEARRVAEEIGDRFQQAAALDGIGRCRHAAGSRDAARAAWQEALAIYRDLGVPEADRLGELLR